MYRFIFSFLILQVVASWSFRNLCGLQSIFCTNINTYPRNDYRKDEQFHILAWQVVRLDRTLQRLCESGTHYVSEVYDDNGYKLSVTLEGYNLENITVKLQYRVLFIQAKKAGGGKGFSELKILPHLVNGKGAVWTFYDNVLEINMPLLDIPGAEGETEQNCVADIDDSVITVPRLDIDIKIW